MLAPQNTFSVFREVSDHRDGLFFCLRGDMDTVTCLPN